MSVLFYDNAATGHHPGYIAGIVAAAERRGVPFVVASVDCPATLADRQRWIKVEPAPLRKVPANRRQLARATRQAAETGASVLIDLYLDKQIWASGAARHLGGTVHVLHHAEQYSLADRSGLAGWRTRYLRRRLRRLVESGSVVVVHNQGSADILGDAVAPERLIRAGYPVNPLPVNRRPPTTSRPILLFVGAGRQEKGLDLLLGALAMAPDIAELRVVGRQPPGLRDALVARHAGVAVTWLDDYVDDETLRKEYGTAHLAILPYRRSFGRHGGPSSVLLETLSAGLPLVTTPALAPQLPSPYGGAEIAASDTAGDLAESMARAVDRISELSSGAAAEGPPFVAANHTFDSYLDRLLEAAELARR